VIGLKLLECVEPFLSVIIEHVFGVYDGNIEVLQNSTRQENVSTLHHLSEGKWFENIHFFLWFDDTCQEKVYRLLLSQIASDDCQIIPFCTEEQGLQDHTLLAAATTAPLPPTLPRPSSVQNDLRQLKFRCAGTGNGKQKLNLSSFGGPLTAWVRKPTKSIFVPGRNFLYRTKPRLVHFLYR
jgi:hypothetical protein